MNSKQVIAAVSVVVLLIILVYPALLTGTISVAIGSMKIDNADHVYLTIKGIWVHEKGQSNATGWKSLYNQSQVVDLISLENSTNPLATSKMSVASYDSVRVVVSNVTWVFNQTTTKLLTASPNLDSNIEFTVAASKDLSITILLGGHQETVGGLKYFATIVKVTVAEMS
ncbi:MAG: DUF4382 domain-containing protein [Candidatus Bathyarchaeia archaeon]|jgi:hypothetical protein